MKQLLDRAGVVAKTLLWVLGIATFFTGLCTATLWPFVSIVTVFIHLQVPVPLGFVPPVFDGTIGAFIVKGAFLVGSASLLIGLVYDRLTVWLIPAAACFLKLLLLRHEAEETKRRFRRLTPSVVWDDDRPYPPLPLLLYLHPYLLNYHGHWDLGGGVRIRRVDPDSTRGNAPPGAGMPFDLPPFDLWYQSNEPAAGGPKKPLFFFVHGGGWIFGASRRHTQVLLLQRLVLHGYVVVAANYRKTKWPQHVDDCYAVLRQLIDEADRFGIDTARITVSGASAGGQIAALLQTRLQADRDRNAPHLQKLAGMVLFYPVTDPGDDCRVTCRLPIPLPPLRYRPHQSFMHWFFEYYAMKVNDDAVLTAASPLRLLTERGSGAAAAATWPPTLVLAGDLDGIVPLEPHVLLLNMLAAHHNQAPGGKDSHVTYAGAAAAAAEPLVARTAGTCAFTAYTDGNPFSAAHTARFGDPTFVRDHDSLLVVPGAKHIFEAGGGKIVEVTANGVVAWLERVTTN